MSPVIVIAILFLVGYVFVVRPARRRSRSHEAMQTAVQPGEEIITAGGIHGIVKESGERELQVEIAPGVVITLDRRAVAAVAVMEDAPEGPS